MKTLRRISYRNIVYFRKADLDLDREGITFVTGLNRNSSEGKRSNGAGKTLLVSGISHLRHGSPIGSASLHRHSLFTEPDSSMEWRLHDGSDDWMFRKAKQGKTVKWDVSRNGDLVTVKTATQAEQMAAAAFDFNDEEFYSTIYLDSRRPSVLLHGTGTARQSFLASLFRLEGYANMRAWFVERLKAARAKETAAVELESSLDDMDSVSKDDLREQERKLDLAKKRAEDLEGRVSSLRDDLAAKQAWAKFQKLEKPAGKYDRGAKKDASAAIEAWRVWERENEDREEAEREAAKWDKRARALADLLSGVKEKSLAALEARLDVAAKTKKHMSDHLADKGSTKCPYCGEKLSRSMAKEKLAAAQGELDRLKPILAKARDLSQDGNRPKVPDKRKKPRRDIGDAKAELKRQAKWEKAAMAVQEMKKAGLSPEKGRDLPSESELEDLLAKAMSKMRKAIKSRDELGSAVEHAKAGMKAREQAKKRARKLAEEAKDAPLLDLLAECYGPKGLRVLAIRNIAGALQDNMNAMASHLCPERMEFSLDASLNSMNVSVVRADGRTSDARHLSGAESRVFQLLYTASVLPLLPSHRRCNVAVLDEFEAGVDETTRQMMVDEYLPRLCGLVPHVIFLSPYEITPDVGRRILRVEKRGGRSVVKEVGT